MKFSFPLFGLLACLVVVPIQAQAPKQELLGDPTKPSTEFQKQIGKLVAEELAKAMPKLYLEIRKEVQEEFKERLLLEQRIRKEIQEEFKERLLLEERIRKEAIEVFLIRERENNQKYEKEIESLKRQLLEAEAKAARVIQDFESKIQSVITDRVFLVKTFEGTVAIKAILAKEGGQGGIIVQLPGEPNKLLQTGDMFKIGEQVFRVKSITASGVEITSSQTMILK